MQVWKYVSIQACNHSSALVRACKYASIQVYDYTNRHAGKRTRMQDYMFASFQGCIYASMIYSAPTLISRPKSVKSRLNPDQNSKKTRPNPDPI